MPPPIIVTPSSSAVGITLRRYRRRLADELGVWLETTASATPAAGDTARVVLAEELQDHEAGYEFMGTWLYVRDGAQEHQQRRIVSEPGAGYIGGMGALTLSRPFDGAIEDGTGIEITNPLPIKRHLGVKGIDDLVNEGLQCCRVRALLTLTGNGGYAYALDAYPWLFEAGQTGGIYDASYLVVSDPPMLNPASTYRIEANGATRRLITEGRSYASSETFTVEVFVRGDILVYDGSGWTYDADSPGLRSDDWQATAPEHWVVAFGMVKGLDYLIRYVRMRSDLGREEKAGYLAEIIDRRKAWYRRARLIQAFELPRSPAGRVEPMVGVDAGYGWT